MMITTALVFAGLAALLHDLHLRAGVAALDRAANPGGLRHHGRTGRGRRELAFNQGFYNLFLAIVTAAGIAMTFIGNRSAGTALPSWSPARVRCWPPHWFCCCPRRTEWRAAVTQGVLPFIAVTLLGVALF